MPQKIIDIDPTKPIETALQDLHLTANSLILLLGAPPVQLDGQIRSIFSRVVAPLCLQSGISLLHDARAPGAASLMAQAASDQDQALSMVGIIEHDRPASEIDPIHDVVLRLPAIWSGHPKYLSQIAGAAGKPITALLLAGTVEDAKTLVCCARRGWPVLVIGKTGGIADEITSPGAAPTHPDLREIRETATTYTAFLDAPVEDLNRIFIDRIGAKPESHADTLRQAWLRCDELDRTALAKQKTFRRLELTLISLAVLAALLSILTVANPFPDSFKAFLHRWFLPAGNLHALVLVTPIVLAMVAAYNSHFRDGTKWILLRGAAEALKREIFRYRAQAGAYSGAKCAEISRESKLAATIKDITSSLEQSDVNRANLAAAPAREDPHYSTLSPDQYIRDRIQDQERYYQGKIRRLTIKLTAMQVSIYVVGGVGTFLAAIKRDIWVALATAMVTAITTKLQGDQVETTLVQYNQALASLKNIEVWWKALSVWEKSRAKNIDLLVEETEKVLESETAGWVRQMQSALDKLTEKQPPIKAGST